MKAIIYLPSVNSAHQPPMGLFSRNQEYDKHIWKGRVFDLATDEGVEDFQAEWKVAQYAFPDRMPRPTFSIFQIVEPPMPEGGEVSVNNTPVTQEQVLIVPRKKRAYRRRQTTESV